MIMITLGILVNILVLSFMANYNIYKIKGKSMEPALKHGDIVVIKKCGIEEIADNSIIAYKGMSNKVILHRVVGSTIDARGKKYVYTKGDNNESADSLAVNTKMIIGRCVLRINVGEKIDIVKE